MTNVVDELIAARDVIKNRENWTRGQLYSSAFETPDGRWIPERWCAVGALRRVNASARAYDALTAAIAYRGYARMLGIERWNDSHSHKAVIRGFDKAITQAQVPCVPNPSWLVRRAYRKLDRERVAAEAAAGHVAFVERIRSIPHATGYVTIPDPQTDPSPQAGPAASVEQRSKVLA